MPREELPADMRRGELVGKLREGVWLVLQFGEDDVGEVVQLCTSPDLTARRATRRLFANDHGTRDAYRHHSWYCGECEQLITAYTKKGDGGRMQDS